MSATQRTTQSLRRIAQVSNTRCYASQVASSSKLASTTSSKLPSSPEAPARVYTDRKTFLYSAYTHLLDNSQLLLLFQPNNLTTAELGKIKRAIAGVPVPQDAQPATLTVTRTGVLSALARARAVTQPDASLLPLLSGPTALLTCPSLSPLYLRSVITAINKSLSYRPAPATPSSLPVSPRLILLGGVMEKTRLVSAQEIMEIGQLPELDTLRSQLVGLLEMPGRQVIGLLSQASGGSLVRTLQGLESDLKAKESGSEEGSAEASS